MFLPPTTQETARTRKPTMTGQPTTIGLYHISLTLFLSSSSKRIMPPKTVPAKTIEDGARENSASRGAVMLGYRRLHQYHHSLIDMATSQ
jgi:hypothetical protein